MNVRSIGGLGATGASAGAATQQRGLPADDPIGLNRVVGMFEDGMRLVQSGGRPQDILGASAGGVLDALFGGAGDIFGMASAVLGALFGGRR